jgi:hypothetical protein
MGGRGVVKTVKVYLEGGFDFDITEEGAKQIRESLRDVDVATINVALARGGVITILTKKIAAITVE